MSYPKFQAGSSKKKTVVELRSVLAYALHSASSQPLIGKSLSRNAPCVSLCLGVPRLRVGR